MKIALIQQPATESREANRARGLKAADEAARLGSQLVCFAELAFDPFYPQAMPEGDIKDLAETIPGPTTEAFASLAKQYEITVVLNIFERDGDRTFDSSPVIDADGRVLGTTRMVHITDYECFFESLETIYGVDNIPLSLGEIFSNNMSARTTHQRNRNRSVSS